MAEQDEQRHAMALTRSFRNMVQSRVDSNPAFGAALLRESVDGIVSGDVDGEAPLDCRVHWLTALK